MTLRGWVRCCQVERPEIGSSLFGNMGTWCWSKFGNEAISEARRKTLKYEQTFK